MISEEQWLGLLPFINQVCNRESDLTVIAEARITRMHHRSIVIQLNGGHLDLEPDPEDRPTHRGWPDSDLEGRTCGPGWPD